MKKIIFILLSCFTLTGCSLLPKINFNTDGTTPQSINKNQVKEICKGKIVFSETGTILSCSKGYFNYTKNYVKKERKYTLKEKIINFFRNLTGWAFWIVIALVIFCPSVLGMIVGRLFEGVFGISKKALDSTVRAIQKARKEGKNLDDSLASEHDNKIKKYIRKIKEDKNIK